MGLNTTDKLKQYAKYMGRIYNVIEFNGLDGEIDLDVVADIAELLRDLAKEEELEAKIHKDEPLGWYHFMRRLPIDIK